MDKNNPTEEFYGVEDLLPARGISLCLLYQAQYRAGFQSISGIRITARRGDKFTSTAKN